MNILELFGKNSPLLLTITPSVYLYELCIPEGKIIKTILLTQNKTKQKAFFINNVSIEAHGTKYKHTQMKLKEQYARLKKLYVHHL